MYGVTYAVALSISICILVSSTSILLAVYQVSLCWRVLWRPLLQTLMHFGECFISPQFPSSTCSGREPFWTSGTGFFNGVNALPVTQPALSRHWSELKALKVTHWPGTCCNTVLCKPVYTFTSVLNLLPDSWVNWVKCYCFLYSSNVIPVRHVQRCIVSEWLNLLSVSLVSK